MNQFSPILLLTLFGLTLSGAAHAESQYIGLDLTTAKINLNGDAKWAYNNQMIDDRFVGAGLVVGFPVNPWLTIESGFRIQRMNQETHITGSNIGTTNATINATSFIIATKLSRSLGGGFSAYAKPALAYTHSDVTASSDILQRWSGLHDEIQFEEVQVNVHPNLEVGLDYAFNDSFSAGIGYERQFNALSLGDDHYSLDTFKLGLRYHY